MAMMERKTKKSKEKQQTSLLKPVLKVQSCSNSITAALPPELCTSVPQADITHMKIQETQKVCA